MIISDCMQKSQYSCPGLAEVKLELVARVSIRYGSGNHFDIISVHLMDVYVCVGIMKSNIS